MSSIRQNILNTLSSDLMKIQVANGYSNDMKRVQYMLLPEQVGGMYPSAGYSVVDDDRVGFLTENKELEVRKIQIKIAVYTNETDKNSAIENIITDLNKLFKDDDSILPIYQSSVNLIEGVFSNEDNRCLNVNKISQINSAGIVICDISVLYLSEYNGNANGSSGLPVVPNILNNYTLTGTFISATGYLQAEIASISGIAISGANTWGSIYGTLSAQIDLYNELNAKSLSGHTHSEYFLNSATGSLTTDLSGYSVTSHNHALSSLDEKSYNSLDDLPNLNAYSITGHTHNDLATTASLSSYTTTASFIATTATLTGALLWTKVGTNAYYTTTSDRVGVGYNAGTALGYTLDVSGKIRCTDNLYTNAALYADTAIWSPVFKPRYNTAFSFQNYYSVPLGTVLSSGEWGIGTTTPKYKFSISGDLSITGSIYTGSIPGISTTVTAGQTMTFTNGLLTSVS